MKLAVQNTFNPFLPIVLNTGCYSCVLLRGTEFEGNRSSPLYAICLNWIHEIQFVDFDSKLFYGRHCQIEPDGEHPTSIERNSSSPLYTTLHVTRFVASFRTSRRCQDANYSGGNPFLESESPALSPDLNGTALHPEEGYVGFSTEVRMNPKPLSHAQVGFEPTFCDKPQFLPRELFER